MWWTCLLILHLVQCRVPDFSGLSVGKSFRGLLSISNPSIDLEANAFSGEANIPPSEYDALQDFYDSTNGPGWKVLSGDDDQMDDSQTIFGIPWDFSDPSANPCTDDWMGIACTNNATADGYVHIAALKLEEVYLKGSIPATISDLPYLSILSLPQNELNSTIPSSVYTMTNLTYFDMSGNQLTGTLPSNIDNLTRLSTFSINYNPLHGDIPDTLYNITSLTYLGLSGLDFDGTLSPLVSQLSELESLYIMLTDMHGPIPDELLCLTRLQAIIMGYNSFTGTLPACPEAFLPNLTHIAIVYNHVDGPIPEWYGNQTGLLMLMLSYNQLTGPIPATLGNPSEFDTIDLDHNRLTGTIPESVARLNLTYLHLQNNNLHGTIPEAIWGSTRLEQLMLSHNHFSGTLSARVGINTDRYRDYSTIADLLLDDNILTGTIPHSIILLQALQTLFLNDNKFTGNLDGIFNGTTMQFLTSVDVSSNKLTGTLPGEVFKPRYMSSFAASHNCFSGSIPQEVCKAARLGTLSLDGLVSAENCQHRFFPRWTGIDSYWRPHPISGTIPTCLFNSLPQLTILHLSGNGFTGSLPDVELSVNLTDLSLSNNAFRGSIPDSFQLKQWTGGLDLSYNMFNGELSDAFPFYGPNASLSLEVNHLSGDIPSSLRDVLNINILDGNLFSCGADRESLPEHDGYKQKYECGSNSVNDVLYTWLALGAVTILGAICLWALAKSLYSRLEAKVSLYLVAFSESSGSPELIRFASFLTDLRTTTVVLSLVIFVVMLCVGVSLSVYFNLYTHEYAWNISSVFLSGVTPAVVLLLVVGALFVVLWAVLLKYLPRGEEGEEGAAESGGEKVQWTWVQWAALVSTVIGNVAVMIAVNIGYVTINNRYSSGVVQTTQVAVSLFKVFWNSFIVKHLLAMMHGFNEAAAAGEGQATPRRDRMVGVVAVVMLFNSIAAPFLAIAFISTNCFYHVITTPPEVTVSYSYPECMSLTENGSDYVCSEFTIVSDRRTTSYPPPFTYSYQCSSTYISVYSSIYIIMLIITTFITPCVQMAAVNLQKMTSKDSPVDRLSLLILSPILRNGRSPFGRDTLLGRLFGSRCLFNCEVFVVQLLNILTILFTFGVVFPPIAVLGCGAILSVCWFTQLCVGRFVAIEKRGASNAAFMEANDDVMLTSGASAVDRDIEGARSIFKSSLWVVVPFAALFYSFLLFDILGDDKGWKVGLAMPIVVIVVVLAVMFSCAVCRRCSRDGRSNNGAVFGSFSSSAGGVKEPSAVVTTRTTLEYDNTTSHRLI